MEIIDELRETNRYAPRFGGGLIRPCPPDPAPPDFIADHEQRYVEQLIEAYCDNEKDRTICIDNVKEYPMYGSHFLRARERYFSAETLKQFSRDELPEDAAFEQVQDEVFDYVVDTYELEYESGYWRMHETIKIAPNLQMIGHPLQPFLKSKRLQGICHQLANADRLRWVRR